jgi:membrane associated rhomboid family serine protease
MTVTPRPARNYYRERADADEFGTVPFYASLGRAFVVMCVVILGLFGIEAIDQLTHHRLDADGAIVTRTFSGLDGIIFAPFLHQSWAHLYGNSVPLLLTGTFVLAGGTRRFVGVTILVALTSGLSAWLFGGQTGSLTIGASGVIFGYLGYLVMRGLVEHTWWTIGVAVLVGLLYGAAISGVVPGDPRISWQGHLGGLIGGLIAALMFRKRRVRPGPLPTDATPSKGTKELPTTLTIPTLD